MECKKWLIWPQCNAGNKYLLNELYEKFLVACMENNHKARKFVFVLSVNNISKVFSQYCDPGV